MPPAHWPPNREERSDQLGHARPLRGPRRGERAVPCTQGHSDLSARGYAHGTACDKFITTTLAVFAVYAIVARMTATGRPLFC